MLKRAVFTRKK